MSHDVIAIIAASLVTLAAAVYTSRASMKMNHHTEEARTAVAAARTTAANVRADGEAYERAMKINQDIVAGMSDEVGRLRAALAELRLQLKAEETRSAALEVRIVNLQLSVNRLSALLAQHSIPIPALGD